MLVRSRGLQLMRAQSFAGTESDQLEALGAVPRSKSRLRCFATVQYEMEWIYIECRSPTHFESHHLRTVVVRRSPSSRITVRHRGEASIRHCLACAIPTAFPQHS